MERDDFQKLIALIDDLSQEQRDLVKKALDGENDLERVVWIIENRLATKRQCAHCHSENVENGVSLKVFSAIAATIAEKHSTLSPIARWLFFARRIVG